MTTETNQDESSQPPFQFGDIVRHQSGDVIKVEACKRVVAHSHLRWAVYDANGNRFWARNCGLVERPLTSGTINEQLDVDPINTNGNATRLFVSSLTTKALGVVHELAVLMLPSMVVLLEKRFRETIEKEMLEHSVGITQTDPGLTRRKNTELRAEIETLAKQRDEAREELKESTAEFVRALSLSNREAVLDRAELVGAKVALKQAKEFADGWREVVAKCERLLQMNGPTPTDPATSAVPLQLEHRLKSLTLLEKRIDDAARILDGGKISVSVNQ